MTWQQIIERLYSMPCELFSSSLRYRKGDGLSANERRLDEHLGIEFRSDRMIGEDDLRISEAILLAKLTHCLIGSQFALFW